MKTGNGGIYHIPQDLKRPEKALGNGLSGLFQSTEVSNSELYRILRIATLLLILLFFFIIV